MWIPHAQIEIRGFATSIYQWFCERYAEYHDYKSLVGGYYLREMDDAAEPTSDDKVVVTKWYTAPITPETEPEKPPMSQEDLMKTYERSMGMEEVEEGDEEEDDEDDADNM